MMRRTDRMGMFDNPVSNLDVNLTKTNELLKLMLEKLDRIEKEIKELKQN